jgi:ribosomal protein L44E
VPIADIGQLSRERWSARESERSEKGYGKNRRKNTSKKLLPYQRLAMSAKCLADIGQVSLFDP